MKELYTIDEAYPIIQLLCEALQGMLDDAERDVTVSSRKIEVAKLAMEAAGMPYEE